jgi:5-dehydro-2-deoxygluconokinase
MIDLFAPRSGQRLADVDCLTVEAGGSASIIAVAAARLGASVSIASAVGDDELGAEWRRRIGHLGVDVSGVVTVPRQLTPISVSTVDIAGEKAYSFYRFRDLCDPLAELPLAEQLELLATTVDVFVATEAVLRAPKSRETLYALLDRRRQDPTRITILSANYRRAGWAGSHDAGAVLREAAARASVVCCNSEEVELIGREALRSTVVFETHGENGVSIHVDGESSHVHAWPVPGGVVLDTGAGDTFCAGIAVALGEGQQLEHAAAFGEAAAALAIGREGTTTATPYRDEVERLLEAAPSPSEEHV